jgi:hypothetical protein
MLPWKSLLSLNCRNTSTLWQTAAPPGDNDYQYAAGSLFVTAFITGFLIRDRNPENDYVVLPMDFQDCLHLNGKKPTGLPGLGTS